jgi:hypothetical protein
MKHSILRRALAKTGIGQKLAKRSRSKTANRACPPSIPGIDLSSSPKDPNGINDFGIVHFDRKDLDHVKHHGNDFGTNGR